MWLRMDWDLKDVSEQGSVNGLYSLIKKDPKVLDKFDDIPFVETPLHIAAAEGKTEFALEMMRLKPSFAMKLDPNGLTPLLVAMDKEQTQLVCELLRVHKDLVCAQGKGGMNPLHYAAHIGNLPMMAEVLKFCPKIIGDVTSKRETVLHIALKSGKLEAFQLLVGWLRRAWFRDAYIWENSMLNTLDLDGNAVLHIAATKNVPQVVRWLLDCSGFRVNVRNSEGLTALDILQKQTQWNNQEMRNMLCRAGAKNSASLRVSESFEAYLISPIPTNERVFVRFFRQRTMLSNDFRNIVLVVAILLVTVAYQAISSPPGGFWQDNCIPETNNQFNITAATSPSSHEVSQPPHRAGTVIMGRYFFHLLFVLNTATFYTPLLLIIILLPPGFTSFLLIISLALLFLSYGASIAITAPLPSHYWFVYILVFSLTLAFHIGFSAVFTWKHGRVFSTFLDVGDSHWSWLGSQKVNRFLSQEEVGNVE